MEHREKERNSLYIIGWIFFGLGMMILVLSKFSSFSLSSFLLPCLLHELTGLYCPGCGGSRAIAMFLEGEFLKSLYFHPLVIYGMLLYFWFMVSNTIERLSNGKFHIGMYYRDRYIKIAVVILILNFIMKNGALLIFKIPMMA